MLFSEGQPPRGVFVLCRGAVTLGISSGDGKTLITRIDQHGECLGLSSVLTGNAYKASAETLEPSQVNFIKREDFLRFLHEHTDACASSSRQLSFECEADADHIRALGLSHSAAEKLAHLLLSWATESGKTSDAGTRVQLLMTHEDISQLIGTSRETVTRLLTRVVANDPQSGGAGSAGAALEERRAPGELGQARVTNTRHRGNSCVRRDASRPAGGTPARLVC